MTDKRCKVWSSGCKPAQPSSAMGWAQLQLGQELHLPTKSLNNFPGHHCHLQQAALGWPPPPCRPPTTPIPWPAPPQATSEAQQDVSWGTTEWGASMEICQLTWVSQESRTVSHTAFTDMSVLHLHLLMHHWGLRPRRWPPAPTRAEHSLEGRKAKASWFCWSSPCASHLPSSGAEWQTDSVF